MHACAVRWHSTATVTLAKFHRHHPLRRAPGRDTHRTAGRVSFSSLGVLAQQNKLVGHHAAINSVAFNQDGSLLASASGSPGCDDNTVRIWETKTGDELAALQGHTGTVFCLVRLPRDAPRATPPGS